MKDDGLGVCVNCGVCVWVGGRLGVVTCQSVSCCYDIGISVDSSSPILFANRSLVRMRQGKLRSKIITIKIKSTPFFE